MKIFYLFILFVALPTSPAAQKLPRVGRIRDYPATGLTAGCGNLYFYFERRTERTGADYVFISNGVGTLVWMNLDGRDTALKVVKTPKTIKIPLRARYRWKQISIDIFVEDFKPPDAPYEEGDSMFRMKIILRRGRAVKTIRAVGDADC